MILCVSGVLSAEALAEIRSLLSEVPFSDGRNTAGWHARLVKENLQADKTEPAVRAEAIVRDALFTNPLFQAAALPRSLRPILFSRYEEGMGYGSHVDDALMGRQPPQRSDVSLTVFLSTPAEYDGGELVIESTAGEHDYKLEAGSAIFYPSTTLHRVAPVTRGARLVAVGWVQSLVRSAARREILFDLDNVRRSIFDRDGKSREFDLLCKSHANLLRLWSET